MPRRLGLLVISSVFATGVVASAACGGSEAVDGPPPLSTGSPSPRDAGPRDTGTDFTLDAMPAPEASAGATTYKGTLDSTPAVKFGGKSGNTVYCEYTLTLEDIEIEIAALESGDVIGATVKDLAVDAIVPPCPHAPMAPSMQRFALTTVTKTASGATLAFEGAASNQPKTSLVIDITRSGAVAFVAAARWKRIDLGPPFDWEVKAKVTLVPQ